MTGELGNAANPPDLPEFRHAGGDAPDARGRPEVLPDGRTVLVIGEGGDVAVAHPPGDNPRQWGNTGALVCGELALRRAGQTGVTEADLVRHAADRARCHVADDPQLSGGIDLPSLAQVLGDFGLPVRVEQGQSLEDLALGVETGRGVLIALNTGALWGRPEAFEHGEANAVVLVTALTRDPGTGTIAGFYVIDAAHPEGGTAPVHVGGAEIEAAWLDAGGWQLVPEP